jgi:hypothetical protein
VWVSTSGNDSTCTRSTSPVAPSSPCLTFQKAYQVATLGDTVGVQDGAYASQTLRDSAGKTGTSPAADVTFTPQHVDGVTVRSLEFGDNYDANNGADHITINGVKSDEVGGTLTHGCGWDIEHGSYDVTLNYIHTCNIYVQGANDTTIQNSELGPCLAKTDNFCTNNFNDSSASPTTNNVVWDNDTIHDYTVNPGDESTLHMQCLFMLTAATIQNSRFYHCGLFDIFFQPNGNTAGDPFDGTVLQNNWFAFPRGGTGDATNPRETAVEFSNATYSNIAIRNNSFYGSNAWLNAATAGSNFSITGNIMSSPTCAPHISYSNNLYIGSSTCSGTGETTTSAYPYVTATDSSNLDYHLK